MTDRPATEPLDAVARDLAIRTTLDYLGWAGWIREIEAAGYTIVRAEAAQGAAPRQQWEMPPGTQGAAIMHEGASPPNPPRFHGPEEEWDEGAAPRAEGLDPRGNAAIEAIDRIQRAILMKGRVASDGRLVTTEVIEDEAREAIRNFHASRPSDEREEDWLIDVALAVYEAGAFGAYVTGEATRDDLRAAFHVYGLGHEEDR